MVEIKASFLLFYVNQHQDIHLVSFFWLTFAQMFSARNLIDKLVSLKTIINKKWTYT